jgi:hypothetical protein
MLNLWPQINDLNRWAQIKLYDTSNDVANSKVKELIEKLATNEKVGDEVRIISESYGLPDLSLIVDGTVKLYECLDRDKLIFYYQDLINLCVDSCV